LRAKGSDGGHNGLKSVAACLKTRDYIRLRIGIQPEHPISNTRKFVLESFPKRDLDVLQGVLEKSVDAIRCLMSEDLQKAMSQFNG
jgi:PTH1 family peptidyl-tRNA hydrolase